MEKRTRVTLKVIGLLFALTGLGISVPEVQGQKLCIKNRQSVRNSRVQLGSKALRLVDSCPRGFLEVMDVDAIRTPSDSDASPFGDGSAGDVTVSSSGAFEYTNTQFRSFTVNEGVTLNIPSGTIIRVQNSFVNNGNIVVGGGGSGSPGAPALQGAGSYLPTAHQGIGFRAALSGEVGDDSSQRRGGHGGIPPGVEAELDVLFASKAYQGRAPAGAGGSSGLKTGSMAGGALYIYSGGSIVVSGLIAANGENASDEFVSCVGGGAGGLVLLAAKSSIDVTTTANVRVTGGAGGESTADCGAGGGGSGGIIALYAPTISNSATVTVSGGAAGSSATTVTGNPRSGGGGGGALGGFGGRGATIGPEPGNAVLIPAEAGEAGRLITLSLDPSSLL